MRMLARVVPVVLMAALSCQLAIAESAFAQAITPDKPRTVPQPGEPKPSPLPDPWGCRKACGNKACCLARTAFPTWDAPDIKPGAYPTEQRPYVRSRDKLCSRIDIVALKNNMSALNVNGRTLGHFDGLQLKLKEGGQTKFQTGQLAYMQAVDPATPPTDCSPGTIPPVTVNTAGNELVIDGTVVGSFDKFKLTADNAAKAKATPMLQLWKRIQIDATKPKSAISVAQIPGTLGAGSGGLPGLGGPSPDPPKHIKCTPGQGKVCPD